MKPKETTKKRILTAFLMTISIFILLNLAFLVDAVFQGLLRPVFEFFIGLDMYAPHPWYPIVMHILFLVLILLISLFIFRSKLKTIYKATYFAIPLATFLVTLGIFLYQSQTILYTLCFLLFLGILYYLYKNKLNWKYYYTLILVSLILLIGNLTGMEI